MAIAAVLLAGAELAMAANPVTPPLYVPTGRFNTSIVVNRGTKPITCDALALIGQHQPVLASTFESQITHAPGGGRVVDHDGGGLSCCAVVGSTSKNLRLTQGSRETAGTGSACGVVMTAP